MLIQAMRAECQAVLYLIFLTIFCIVAGIICELWWYAGFIPVILLAFPTWMAVNAIVKCKNEDFKVKISVALTTVIIIGCTTSVLSLIWCPQATLTLVILTVALSCPHYHAIDSMKDHKPFETPQAAVASCVFMIISIPLSAYCFTINWTATILPVWMFAYAHAVATESFLQPLLDYPNFNFRFVSKIILILAATSSIGLAISLIASSQFITFTAAATTIALLYLFVDMIQLEALRQEMGNEINLNIAILANSFAALAISVVAGVSRSISTESYQWELAGAMFITLIIMPLIVDQMESKRAEDRFLLVPNPMTFHSVKKLLIIDLIILLMVGCLFGSYFLRLNHPRTASLFPTFLCFLLLVTLQLIEGLRSTISAKRSFMLSVLFSVITIGLISADYNVFFHSHSVPLMEAITAGVCLTSSVSYYFIRLTIHKE